MFNRLREAIAGEPAASASPDKSPRVPPPSNRQDVPHTPRSGGLLSPLFGGPSSNGSERSGPPQDQQRSFFGGWGGSATSPTTRQLDNGEISPGTVRASAAALLKIATPPLGTDHAHPEINPHAFNDGIDAVDLAQRDTLEDQINRRDAYISKLQHDLHRMQNQLGQYQKDNNTLRRQQLESTHRHGIAIKLWRRTNDGLKARVECFENETTPAAAREIANLIRDAAPPNKDSAYLMMLQDQLQKATVKLDHLGSQTEIVLHKGEEVVESLREEMNEVIRERCRMELELLDQERMLEDDMRRMVVKTERRLKRVQGEIDFLEKNAVEALKSQEDESDGENEGSKDGSEQENDGEGDQNTGGDLGQHESANDDRAKSSGGVGKSKEKANGEGTKGGAEQQQTPEILRKELRKLATERDRSLSVLQKKLREKNEEFHNLMRLKDSREKSIKKLEAEKADREEWERSRADMI